MLPGLSCEGLEGQRQASHGVPTGGCVSEPLASARLQGSWPLYGNSHIGWISNGCPGPQGRAPHALGVPPASWLFLGGTSLPLAAPARLPRALCPRDSPRPPSVAKLSKLAHLLSPRPSLFSCLLFFKAPVPFGTRLLVCEPHGAGSVPCSALAAGCPRTAPPSPHGDLDELPHHLQRWAGERTPPWEGPRELACSEPNACFHLENSECLVFGSLRVR